MLTVSSRHCMYFIVTNFIELKSQMNLPHCALSLGNGSLTFLSLCTAEAEPPACRCLCSGRHRAGCCACNPLALYASSDVRSPPLTRRQPARRCQTLARRVVVASERERERERCGRQRRERLGRMGWTAGGVGSGVGPARDGPDELSWLCFRIFHYTQPDIHYIYLIFFAKNVFS